MVERISGIELFGFDIGSGSLPKARWGLLRLTCGNVTGWSECVLPAGGFDWIKWAYYLLDLRRLTIEELREQALRCRAGWGTVKSDLMLDALLDAEARLKRMSLSSLAQHLSVQPAYPLASGSDTLPGLMPERLSVRAATLPRAAKAAEWEHPALATDLMRTLHAAQSALDNGVLPATRHERLLGPGRTALRLLYEQHGASWSDGAQDVEIGSLGSSFGTGFEMGRDTLLTVSRAYFSVL